MKQALKVHEAALARGVKVTVYLHSHYENLGYKRGLCPNAEKFYEEVMSIPLYYSLTDSDVQDVITAVKKVVEYYKK